ncbi:MAG: 4Fe-4S binding protein [Nitrososphaerota archaeon]
MRKRIQPIRHIIQVLFFVLLLFMVVGTICSFALGGVEFTEPLGALQVLVGVSIFNTPEKLYFLLASSAVLVVVTVIIGRAWCAWACPIMSVNELIEYVMKKSHYKPLGERGKKNREFGETRFATLAGVVAAAGISGSAAWCNFCPIGAICRTRSSGLIVAGAEVMILGMVFSANLYEKRFFCKYLCPVGGLLILLSKISAFFVPRADEKCRSCRACESICPEGIPLYSNNPDMSKCTKCLVCYTNCPYGAVRINII